MNPERTCVACRQKKDKSDLLKFVKNTEGHVEYDPTQKKCGRGAYVCRNKECTSKAFKGILFRRLRAEQDFDNRQRLESQLKAL